VLEGGAVVVPVEDAEEVPWRCIGWCIIVSFVIVIRRTSPRRTRIVASSARVRPSMDQVYRVMFPVSRSGISRTGEPSGAREGTRARRPA
jgi:hypothetical protein